MEKLKFGMIGGAAGSFIGDVHLKAALFDGLGDLAAGCFSRDHEKSLAFGQEHGIDVDRVYRSFGEMAEKEAAREDPVDFVIVAAPNDVHYDCCKAFLERGINVVCDKPLTHTSAQAEELKRIAEAKDLLLAVTYTYSAMPAAAFMRELIASGGLGKLLLIKGEYLSDNLLVPNEQLDSGMLWRIDPAKAGPSTCCADIGVHCQHLISFVTGLAIEELSADMNVIGEDRVLDTNFTATVRYQDGVKGHLWCSNVAAGSYNGLSISVYGTKGSVHWSLEEPDIVTFGGGTPGQTIQYRMGKTGGCDMEVPAGGCDAGLSTGGSGTASSTGGCDPDPSSGGMPETGIFKVRRACAPALRLPAGQGEGYYLAFAKIYRAFMTALMKKRMGQPFAVEFPTASDGIESLRFVEACLESSGAGGKWVKL